MAGGWGGKHICLPIYSQMLYSLVLEYKPDMLCAGIRYTSQMHSDGSKFIKICKNNNNNNHHQP